MDGYFVTVLFVLGLIMAAIWRRHLRDAKLLKLREMIHKERMANMDSMPPDAARNRQLDELLLDMARQEPRPQNPRAALTWIRLVALCIGLASLFGGVGTAIGLFQVTADPEVSGMWSMGIIPAAVGLGLLVFYYLSRNFSVPTNGE